jgi:creatinine amidohydrolase/Fe(II)-dependent formamide hydrolase-like protein
MGDPSAASAEKGEKVLRLMTDYIKAYLQEFRELSAPRETE